MSKQEFIELHGGTYKRHVPYWSYVNEDKQFVMFSAPEEHIEKDGDYLVLSTEWELNAARNRRNPGYAEGGKHVRLIEEQGYQLKIFVTKKRPGTNRGRKIVSGLIGPLSLHRYKPSEGVTEWWARKRHSS